MPEGRMPEDLIFIAVMISTALSYAAEKEGGTRQGFKFPRAWTAIRQG